jgi:hypothetical protein
LALVVLAVRLLATVVKVQHLRLYLQQQVVAAVVRLVMLAAVAVQAAVVLQPLRVVLQQAVKALRVEQAGHSRTNTVLVVAAVRGLLERLEHHQAAALVELALVHTAVCCKLQVLVKT